MVGLFESALEPLEGRDLLEEVHHCVTVEETFKFKSIASLFVLSVVRLLKQTDCLLSYS